MFDVFFAGDYWILKIDYDYKVVLVGTPSRKYLWILSRSAEIQPEVYAEYAKKLGFNTVNLYKTLHSLLPQAATELNYKL